MSDKKLDISKDEYGHLIGNIESISSSSYLDPNGQGYYLAELSIPLDSQPNFKGSFRFVHNMTGKADIIVKD